MEAQQLVSALIGATFGALGWLFVGLYMQRRQYDRNARNAARAVYFELKVNSVAIQVAADHGVYGDLSKSAFDRLLPELATWLRADELESISRAYMGHAGYGQVRGDTSVPSPVRAALLQRILGEQRAAMEALLRRSFSADEARRMGTEATDG